MKARSLHQPVTTDVVFVGSNSTPAVKNENENDGIMGNGKKRNKRMHTFEMRTST